MEKKSDSTLSDYPILFDAIIDLLDIPSLNNKAASETIEKLKVGNYQGADFELKYRDVYPLYGVRTNRSDRILSTLISVKSKSYLIHLEMVYNHEYDKAFFMRAGNLKKFINDNWSLIEDFIAVEEKKIQAARAATKSEPTTQKPYQVATLHDKIVALSEEQGDLLLHLIGPALILGAPGAGKSLLALKAIHGEMMRDTGTPGDSIVYIAQSPTLVSDVINIFGKFPHPNPYGRNVLFMTYNQLVKKYSLIPGKDTVDDKDLVDKKHCVNWIENYLNLKANKRQAIVKELLAEYKNQERLCDLIYQEFRIICGYTLAQYKTVKTLFNNLEQRQWLLKLYNDYLDSLVANKKIHPAFYNFSELINCPFMVVDEAFDLSLNQLKELYRSCPVSIYLGDPDQSLEDHFSKIPYILGLAPERFGYFQLSGSHRSPREVIAFANRIQQLKLILTRGGMLKHQPNLLSVDPDKDPKNNGALQWYESLDDIPNKEEFLARIKGSAQVAIICATAEKEHYKKFFNTISVFSTEEIKGLQFAWVIEMEPLNHPLLIEANKEPVIQASDMEIKVPSHRPKAGEEHFEYGPPLQRFYVGVTRCTQRYIAIQPHVHGLRNLIAFLRPETKAPKALDINELGKDSALTWLLKAGEAFDGGNLNYARDIFISHLNKTEEDFNKWRNKRLESKNPPPASAPPANVPKQQSGEVQEKNLAKTLVPKEVLLKDSIDFVIQTEDRAALKDIITKSFNSAVALSTKMNVNLLYYVVRTRKGAALFMRQLQSPELVKWLIKQNSLISSLCTLYDENGNGDRTSALFYLLKFDVVSVFSGALITTKLLHHTSFIRALLASAEGNISALYMLSIHETTLKLLRRHLKDLTFKTNLLKDDELCTALVARRKTILFNNASVLYWLVQHIDGLHIILNLSEGDSLFLNRLCSHNQIITTFLAPVICDNNHNKDSLFNRMVLNNRGLILLNYLIQDEQFLNNLVTHPDFLNLLLLPNDCKDNRGLTTFEYLSSTPEGIKLFTNLNRNQELFTCLSESELFLQALCSFSLTIVDSPELTTPLQCFLMDDKARMLFVSLASVGIFFDKMLASECFLTALLTPNKEFNISCLTVMLAYRDTIELINRICEDNRFFLKVAENVHFADRIFLYNSEEYSIAKLYTLVEVCPKLVLKLFNNAVFLERFLQRPDYMAALFKRDKHLAPSTYNESILLIMLCPTRMSLLANLCKNKTFVDYMLQDSNFLGSLLAIPHPLREKSCMNGLYQLLTSPEGFQIFLKIGADQEFTKKMISHPDFLCALLQTNQLHVLGISISAFHALIFKPQGLEWFAQWCDDERFRNQLINNSLFKLHLDFKFTPFAQGETTAYSFLESSELGRTVLRKLSLTVREPAPVLPGSVTVHSLFKAEEKQVREPFEAPAP